MKVETYKKIRAMLVGVMGLVTAVAVNMDKVFVVFLVVGAGMVVMTWLKAVVKEKIEDERVESVAGRAARTAFTVLMPVVGLTSLALFAAGGREEFFYVRALGIVLSYVTCLGLVIYSVAYWWIDRQLGGKE